MSTTIIRPEHTYRWRRTRRSRGVCSHRARAGWWQCHTSVGFITNTCGRRREPIGAISGRHKLELIKEVVPKVSRVALLPHPTNPASATYTLGAEAAARSLGVRLQTLDARTPQEIDSAFAAMTRERAGALMIFP